MNLFDRLSGHFGDWETFVHDTDFDNIVFRVFDPEVKDPSADYYQMIGSTILPNNDIMLMCVSGEYDTPEEAWERSSIYTFLLSDLLSNWGFMIVPKDQYNYGEE